MKTLTVAKPLPNLTRWEVDDADWYEKRGFGVIRVVMRTAGPTNYTIRRELQIRNGLSDVVSYLAVVGGELQEQLVVTVMSLSTPTGCTDAFAAYRAGGGNGNGQARRDALEAWMLTSGVAHSSLAGA